MAWMRGNSSPLAPRHRRQEADALGIGIGAGQVRCQVERLETERPFDGRPGADEIDRQRAGGIVLVDFHGSVLERQRALGPFELTLGVEGAEAASRRPVDAQPARCGAQVGRGDLGLRRQQLRVLAQHQAAFQRSVQRRPGEGRVDRARHALCVEAGAERRIEGDLLAAEIESAGAMHGAVRLRCDGRVDVLQLDDLAVRHFDAEAAVAHDEAVELHSLQRLDERRDLAGVRVLGEGGLAGGEVGGEDRLVERHLRAVAGDEHGDHLAAAGETGAARRDGQRAALKLDGRSRHQPHGRAEAVAVGRGGEDGAALQGNAAVAVADESGAASRMTRKHTIASVHE